MKKGEEIRWNTTCLISVTGCLGAAAIFKGGSMKILDKVELIVKLKEKIEEAKKENAKAAERLQGLLESIMKSGELKAV